MLFLNKWLLCKEKQVFHSYFIVSSNKVEKRAIVEALFIYIAPFLGFETKRILIMSGKRNFSLPTFVYCY